MINYLLDMPRSFKKAVFLSLDTLLAFVSLYLAIVLRYGTFLTPQILTQSQTLFFVMALAAPVTIMVIGLHRIKLNAFQADAIARIAITAAVLSLSTIIFSYLFKLFTPRSVPLIFGAVFFLLSVAMRVVALRILQFFGDREMSCVPVIIYGAGAAGIQLAAALQQSVETRPVLFVDDNPNLHGVMIGGMQVYQPKQLQRLIAKHKIERVLVAIPTLTEQRKTVLLASLADLPVEVKMLPSFIDLMAGRGIESSLRSVSPDELLGRDMVDLLLPEIENTYAGRVVMVTGAGGSIGSELCRQLINCKPEAIVLFERSEFALYSIDSELKATAETLPISILPRLGSVTRPTRVAHVIQEFGVDIILHAAAYKHVPMVEENEIEGAANNSIGTKVVADAAIEAGVERFILVSTDKAVRPTNIMGATKRIAELIIQDLQTRSPKTKFSMVRFGNVLGSSGSVLPLFQKQIEQGGPVTVTHRDVTRYFMTIPEATRLVLLAGAYAEGGDVFVLDMGAPKRIIDLADRMIRLSGRTPKDPETGEGDIEVKVVGLRPGEKLYEELLVDDSLCGTPHAKILRAEEKPISQIEAASLIRGLQAAIDAEDAALLRKLIEERVDGYHLQPVDILRA